MQMNNRLDSRNAGKYSRAPTMYVASYGKSYGFSQFTDWVEYCVCVFASSSKIDSNFRLERNIRVSLPR